MFRKYRTFAEALDALQNGKMVTREVWFKSNEFVFMQIPASVPKDLVSKMQSLPDSVKQEFEKRFNNPDLQIDKIYYQNQLGRVNGSNMITGYSPLVSDILAEDWLILE